MARRWHALLGACLCMLASTASDGTLVRAEGGAAEAPGVETVILATHDTINRDGSLPDFGLGLGLAVTHNQVGACALAFHT